MRRALHAPPLPGLPDRCCPEQLLHLDGEESPWTRCVCLFVVAVLQRNFCSPSCPAASCNQSPRFPLFLPLSIRPFCTETYSLFTFPKRRSLVAFFFPPQHQCSLAGNQTSPKAMTCHGHHRLHREPIGVFGMDMCFLYNSMPSYPNFLDASLDKLRNLEWFSWVIVHRRWVPIRSRHLEGIYVKHRSRRNVNVKRKWFEFCDPNYKTIFYFMVHGEIRPVLPVALPPSFVFCDNWHSNTTSE